MSFPRPLAVRFKETSCKILQNLIYANLDYIECGFLKLQNFDKEKSFYPNYDFLEKILPNNYNNTKFTLMINYGEYPLENLPICKNKNIAIRIVFKKSEKEKAIAYCK